MSAGTIISAEQLVAAQLDTAAGRDQFAPIRLSLLPTSGGVAYDIPHGEDPVDEDSKHDGDQQRPTDRRVLFEEQEVDLHVLAVLQEEHDEQNDHDPESDQGDVGATATGGDLALASFRGVPGSTLIVMPFRRPIYPGTSCTNWRTLRFSGLWQSGEVFTDDVPLHLTGTAGDAPSGCREHPRRLRAIEHRVGACHRRSQNGRPEHHLRDAELHQRRGD